MCLSVSFNYCTRELKIGETQLLVVEGASDLVMRLMLTRNNNDHSRNIYYM